MAELLRDQGVLKTAHASKYLQQLCRHFAHKVEARYDENSGEVALPPGPCTLTADETRLQVEVTAQDPEGLERARDILDSHLIRFAFREEVSTLSWTRQP